MSTSYGTWVVPPAFGAVGDYSNLPSYGIGNTQTINWTTTQEDTQIWLLHDGDNFNSAQLNLRKTWCGSLLSGNRGQSWNWPIQQPANYSSSTPVYYLQMRSSSSLIGLFTSHYFNILPRSLLSQSPSLISSTSSSSSSRTSSTNTATGATTTTSSSSSITSASAITTVASITSAAAAASTTSIAAADTGLSSGTKTAIGVAVGVGVPMIALLAVISFLLYRRNNMKESVRNHDQYQRTNPPVYKDRPENVNNYNKPQDQYAFMAHEMPPSQPQHQNQQPQQMSSSNYPSYRNTPSELSGSAYSPR